MAWSLWCISRTFWVRAHRFGPGFTGFLARRRPLAPKTERYPQDRRLIPGLTFDHVTQPSILENRWLQTPKNVGGTGQGHPRKGIYPDATRLSKVVANYRTLFPGTTIDNRPQPSIVVTLPEPSWPWVLRVGSSGGFAGRVLRVGSWGVFDVLGGMLRQRLPRETPLLWVVFERGVLFCVGAPKTPSTKYQRRYPCVRFACGVKRDSRP